MVNSVTRESRGLSYVDGKIDLVFFWKQNDTGIYGRRQDMLIKYLERVPRVHRIFHFDAPIAGGMLVKNAWISLRMPRSSHGMLILRNSLGRALGIKDKGKTMSRTFVYTSSGGGRQIPSVMRRFLPTSGDYRSYLARIVKRERIGERRTAIWICPKNFHFASLVEVIKPDVIVADVIDDHRTWPKTKADQKELLTRNYREILGASDIAFANCRRVLENMRTMAKAMHLLPNAAELMERDSSGTRVPFVLRKLGGPIIGYMGNLDIARIDLKLLREIAQERPDWNLVFIGSMHQGKEILELKRHCNVHFLGVKRYEVALRYARNFDVAIVPHLDNALTRHMSPLKVYVYLSLNVPVVSTRIENLEDVEEFIDVGNSKEEVVERIEECLLRRRDERWHGRLREFLHSNSWERRVAEVVELLERQFKRREVENCHHDGSTVVESVSKEHGDKYSDICSVCGHQGLFHHRDGSIRESYRCRKCRASLRYREQARLILKHYSREESLSLAELAKEGSFRDLRIYEPGLIGPFRKVLGDLPGYCKSGFWSEVESGSWNNDVQCQNLMRLTYKSDSFDVVLSSDIFEHVRRPFVGFREVDRVLKPGGLHIFSIPLQQRLTEDTIARIDTSGAEDVPLLPKHYHGTPSRERSLVYTDFGADMKEIMANDGIELVMESPDKSRVPAFVERRMLSFWWQKKPSISRVVSVATGESDGGVSSVPCNICGRYKFRSGPKGRRARGGKLPACSKCGSLERHRLIRRVWNFLPREHLCGKRVLQFSNDPTVEEKWFGAFEISIYGHRNSLDLERIDRGGATYDIVICNHVLEHVGNDQRAFGEIMRVLRPEGFLQFSVPNPMIRDTTEDWGYPDPERHGHYRTYGRDLVVHFGIAHPGVQMLEAEATDEVTGIADLVYFASMDSSVLDSMERWFDEFQPKRYGVGSGMQWPVA